MRTILPSRNQVRPPLLDLEVVAGLAAHVKVEDRDDDVVFVK